MVDNGDFIRPKVQYADLRADATLEAMQMMDYDAINIADGEIRFGIEALDQFSGTYRERLISANLISENGELKWKPYLSRRIGALKIAFIGTVAPALLPPGKDTGGSLRALDDEGELKRWVPRLKRDHDLVVLLSHAGWKHSISLAKVVGGIDLIIVGHDYYPHFESETVDGTTLFKCSVGGKHLGLIKWWRNGSGGAPAVTGDLIPLTDDISVNPIFAGPEKNYEKRKRIRRSLERKREGKRGIPEQTTHGAQTPDNPEKD
ncbi:MAG: hypothetical protein CSA23_02855 [Deltaproteobacteria bacterium]|nr:MAG: hypothetical protein CSA23_02855 [Deltaproteobacteria bacterium]